MLHHRLVELLFPALLIRVDEHKIALFASEASNLVHEGCVVASGEAHGEELGAQVANRLNASRDHVILFRGISTSLWVISILSVSDENYDEFFCVGIAAQELLNLDEHIHEVGATSRADVFDTIGVRIQVWLLEHLNIAVVDDGVELLEGAMISTIVLLANQLSADLQCLDWRARH